ncbi:MAG TPA: cytochrome P450 [Candidatus Thermoplasmatota archaeon]|nr:cytochrome P450 [Candidatus Thermoplasmatota archaeon]
MSRGSRADRTPSLLRDPYGFIGRRLRRAGSDVGEARLLLQRTLLLAGREAAEVFYDGARFQREGAAPVALQRTLLGEGGVQTLDGDLHRHRKALFLRVLDDGGSASLAQHVEAAWEAALPQWRARRDIVLYDEVRPVLAAAACRWAGIAVPDGELATRTQQLTALFQGAASRGASHVRARWSRRRVDRWAADLVAATRDGRLLPPAGSPLHQVATHKDPEGHLLPPREAAVELVNLLRPTVAVSVYITQLAHAIHTHPEWSERLRREDAWHLPFVQEVRRHYPFFPAVPARVRTPFTYHGKRLEAGTRALLDLHGTNHDPKAWADPHEFRPGRFAGGPPDAFAFVPQGGGDAATGHRCPGEPATVAILQVAVRMLTQRMRYDVPPQDLGLDTAHAPALPRSGFRLVVTA